MPEDARLDDAELQILTRLARERVAYDELGDDASEDKINDFIRKLEDRASDK
jgi:hypothetical protein